MEKCLIFLTLVDWFILPFMYLMTGEMYMMRSIAGFIVIPYIVHLFFIPKTYTTLIAFENFLVLLYFKRQLHDLVLSKDREFVVQAVDTYTMGVIAFAVAVWLLGLVQHVRCESILEAQTKTAKSLQESNDKLQETVKALNQANAKLELALKAKDYLLAGVSHELRNPLNSLLGNLELLSMELMDPRHQEMLSITKVCGELLLTMINNLLDAGKMMSHIEISTSNTDIYELIDKVWKLNVFKFKQKNLKAELLVSRKLPQHVLLDAHRVMQILLNIIGNSTKFTETGKLQLFIDWYQQEGISNSLNMYEPHQSYQELTEVKNRCINPERPKNVINLNLDAEEEEDLLDNRSDFENKYTLAVKRLSNMLSNAYHIFSVEDQNIVERLVTFRSKVKNETEMKKGILRFEIVDTGCGITQDAQEKLFQPFTQEDSTITRKYGGTGLGLFISKSVLNKMNGEIVLHSRKNIGTDIIVTIPCEELSLQIKSTEITTNISSQSLSKTAHKIMIVDDAPYNLLILSQYFQKLGITATQCEHGQDAFQKFSSAGPQHFSFLTLDIQMPEMDGLTLAKKIRKFEKENKWVPVPIAFISGNCVEEERLACLDPAGEIQAAAFIRKPVTLKECVKLTRELIRPTKNILLVDDDPFHTKLLSNILAKYDIITTIAYNERNALELVKNNPTKFYAIVMDCDMPLMDVIAYTVNIKKWIKTRNASDIAIVGITAHTNSKMRKECIQAGMQNIFHKPVNVAYFTEYVSKIIANS
jgi:signal transduction histidine kinase/DNA-binding response OmpR family regulator